MEAQERNLIKSASVDWSSYSQDWYISGTLNIGKYEVKIEKVHFPTIDLAVGALKKAMAIAVVEFKDHITQT